MKLVLFLKGQLCEVVLSTNCIARGGEGEIYSILEPTHLQSYCAKIYYPNKITDEKVQKLLYLEQHPPIKDNKGHQSVIWIEGILYKPGTNGNFNFVGFIMPYTQGYSVEYLCTTNFPIQRIPSNEQNEYTKFDRNHSDSLRARLTVCYNIAIALAQVHETRSYVHADIKPENFIFNSKGKVSLLDFDTVQIAENGNKLYSAFAHTPEYLPSFLQGKNSKNLILSPFTDVFSMVVIFYRILVGIHPFAASNFKAPYEQITDIPSAIREKLFWKGQKAGYFNAIPHLHQTFNTLPKTLQDIFIEVLEKENSYLKAQIG